MSSPLHQTTVLGHGSYGCVLQPPLPCRPPANWEFNPATIASRAHHIGKLFYEDENAEKEFRLAGTIVGGLLDPRHGFTPAVEGMCNVQPADVSLDVRRQCQPPQSEAKEGRAATATVQWPLPNQPIRQMVQHSGGVPWTRLPRPLSVLQLLNMVNYAALGISNVFVRNRYLHCDIKPDNLLWDSSKHTAQIIDYSLMCRFDDAFNASTRRESLRWYVHPPEFSMLNHIRHQQHAFLPPEVAALAAVRPDEYLAALDAVPLSLLNADSIVDAGLRRASIIITSDAARANAANLLRGYYAWLVERQTLSRSTAPSVVSLTLDKVDIYGLGVSVMCTVYPALCHLPVPLGLPPGLPPSLPQGSSSRVLHVNFDPVVSWRELLALIGGMIHPDPRQRWTAAQTKQQIDILLQRYHVGQPQALSHALPPTAPLVRRVSTNAEILEAARAEARAAAQLAFQQWLASSSSTTAAAAATAAASTFSR